MRIRAQFALIFNLDKCIGCHTCSVTCKNIWTNRKGVEYAWFNNVESKPGIGYPMNWENQEKWSGGWIMKDGALELKAGGRLKKLIRIFANPDMPQIDDYYEPFSFDYARLQNAPLCEATPTARPISLITGERMEKIHWGPNWEDDLAGEFSERSEDSNFRDIRKQMYAQFENTFHLYLPRMCNHCLNPACVASCPSGSAYKREEDGIVLVDQDKCRGWRYCISGCPYKKVYFNWESSKAEKCIGCYPRVESGMPTACSESCVGRIRYNGILLYDADRILRAASAPNTHDLYQTQLGLFLDPNDPKVVEQARIDGIPESSIEAAQKSPIYKLAIEWKLAFPLHPEFRTLPMVWYIPPLSPLRSKNGNTQHPGEEGNYIPDLTRLRIPLRYLANLFTDGDEIPITLALRRLIAVRAFQRSVHVDGKADSRPLNAVGLSEKQANDIYHLLAIANHENRFVVPTGAEETRMDDSFAFQGQNGFTFGNDASNGISPNTLFPQRRRNSVEKLDSNTESTPPLPGG